MAFKLILDGGTGSGKTYTGIHLAKKVGNFAYLAPCRQLAYESFIFYAEKNDGLSTGEVYIKRKNNYNNCFFVYESFKDIDLFDTIIIDESHFLTDPQRGSHLYNSLKAAEKAGKNIVLSSATRNFKTIPTFKIKTLKSREKPIPIKKVSYSDFLKRVEGGQPSIDFVRRASDADISASTTPAERLQKQLDFMSGKISFIKATNCVAQGLNFPATNINIDSSWHDGQEEINQKIGRMGRPNFKHKTNHLTYSVVDLDEEGWDASIKKIKKNKKIRCSSLVCDDHLTWKHSDNERVQNNTFGLKDFYLGATQSSKYAIKKGVNLFPKSRLAAEYGKEIKTLTHIIVEANFKYRKTETKSLVIDMQESLQKEA